MILTCTCDHKDQDELHGRGRRVHNQRKDSPEYRCTVCGKIRGPDKFVPVRKQESKKDDDS